MAVVLRVTDVLEDNLVAAAKIDLALSRKVWARLEVMQRLIFTSGVRTARDDNVMSAERVERPLCEARAHERVAEVRHDRQIADEPYATHDDCHDERLLVVLVTPKIADHDHVCSDPLVVHTWLLMITHTTEPLARSRAHSRRHEIVEQIGDALTVTNAVYTAIEA